MKRAVIVKRKKFTVIRCYDLEKQYAEMVTNDLIQKALKEHS